MREKYELPLDEGIRMRDYTTLGAVADYMVRRLNGEPLPERPPAAVDSTSEPAMVPGYEPAAAV